MNAPKITSWLDALNAFEVANKPYVIATVIRAESPSSGKPGDKAVISPDGDIFGWIGGGCAQPVVTKAVADVLSDGKPMIVRISPSTGKTVTENGVRDVHMACHSGGSIELLVEPRLQRRSVLLVGATPVAKKLETVAPMLSIPLVRFEDGIDPNGLFEVAVVATQGKKDKDGLKQALRYTVGKIYFIASSKKAKKLKEQLIDDGVTESDINRICAPAGIEIHAETADEIAVSILASIIKDTREKVRELARTTTGQVA